MVAFDLRPYQHQGIVLIKDKFRQGRRKVLLVFPTGGGKTVTFSALIKLTLEAGVKMGMFKKTLILTHRVELLTQAGGTLARFGIPCTSLVATTKNKDINFGSQCMVAMVETYANRLAKFPELADYDLVIIDEAHYGNFKKIFRAWKKLGKNMFVVGATATPMATTKKDPLNNYYQDIVCPVTIEDLISINSLVPCKTFSADLDRSQLKRDYSNEDGYKESSQMEMFDKREVYLGLIEKFKMHCLNPDGTPKKTICFNVNVAHSKAVCQSFIEAGFRAIHVDGYMDKEDTTKDGALVLGRDSILKAFAKGEYDILCNPNIVTAGYDNPAVENIIINKATKSVTMWLQACGRGSRPCPEIGKEFFTVLDMAENWTELRLWSADRDWEAIFFDRPSNRPPGAAPSKKCKACGHINHAAATVCAECGEPFPVKAKGPAENPDFIQVQADEPERQKRIREVIKSGKAVTAMTVEELIDLAELKGYKKNWVVVTLKDRCRDLKQFAEEIQYFADEKNYFQGWVDRQIEWFKEARNIT